jgi:hypothetical protein
LTNDKALKKEDEIRKEQVKWQETLLKHAQEELKRIFEPIYFVDSVASYTNMSQSIANIDKSIKLLGFAMADPSARRFVYPALRKLKETRNEMVHSRLSFLGNNKSELEIYEKSVEDYANLINKHDVEEPALQIFFEKNAILINQMLKQIIPKKSFGGECFPDFIAVLHNGTHFLIEIEKPSNKIYTKRGHPTAKFAQAEQQVRDYLQWANREQDYLRRRGLPNISVENTKGILIIGMRKNLTSKEKEKLAQQNFSSRSSHEIKTFDDILEENLQIIRSIRKNTKKSQKS